MDSNLNLRTRTLRSLGAIGFLQIFQRVISTGIKLILYRFLSPQDFGILAICKGILNFIMMFQDLGVQDALVQKKKEPNFSDLLYTAWIFRIFLTGACLLLIFLSADFWGVFFKQAQIAAPFRALSLLLVLNLLIFPIDVTIRKHVRFEKFMGPDIAGQLISGALSIFLAIKGYGFWSLVVSGLSGQFFRYFILSSTASPKFSNCKLDIPLLLGFMRQALMMFGTALLSFALTQSLSLVVGKIFDVATAGYFYLAFNWSSFVLTYAIQISGRVVFPAVAEIENDLPKVRKAYWDYLRWTSFAAAPFSVGLALLAPLLIPLLAGKHWGPAIPLCQILCLYSYLRSLSSPNYTVLQSLGHYQAICFYRAVELGIFLLFVYPASKWGGLNAVAFLLVLSKGIGWLLSSGGMLVSIKEKMTRLVNIMAPSLISSLLMGGFLYGLKKWLARFGMNDFVLLVSLCIASTVFYGILYSRVSSHIKYAPSRDR